MLEPSAIGEVLGIPGNIRQRGQKINDFLVYIVWQIRIGKECRPTKEGEKHCARHAWKRGNKSGYNLKWRLSEVKKAWDEVSVRDEP